MPKAKQHRSKSFTADERSIILKAATVIRDTSNPFDAAKRWVPWLQAYSGARPQEVTQLRGTDVKQVEGTWTLNLTPEAGNIKTGRARMVPLHEHLIEQGFLDFVRSRGEGPLFYRSRAKEDDSADPTKQKKAPAAQVRQRLATWVRKLGVNDKAVSPNHAWRHTFKLIGRRIEPEDTLLDYICGHAPATEGRAYGAPALQDLARVIRRFPKYEI